MGLAAAGPATTAAQRRLEPAHPLQGNTIRARQQRRRVIGAGAEALQIVGIAGGLPQLESGDGQRIEPFPVILLQRVLLAVGDLDC